MAAMMGGMRRRIAVRLAGVGLAVAAACGGALFVLEGAWVERVSASLAAVEARWLAGQLAQSPGGVSGARLESLLATIVDPAQGNFIWVEVRDPTGRMLGRAEAPDAGAEIARFRACLGQHSWIGEDRCGRQLIDDAVLVRVQVPITLPGVGTLGQFEGIHRLPPRAVDAIRVDNAKLFGVVIGGVVLTALAFYPLMAALQGQVLAEARALLRANLDILKVLGSAVAKRDWGTRTHNSRVTLYSVRLAEALGLDEDAIRALIKGALLHDVGKVAVRDAVLLKPGPLDPAETEEMRAHVRHGLDIIAASHWLRDAAPVVGGHHEKVDGSGYPLGLAGEAVPLAARIFAVADVFDALTSARPYKAALSLDAALAILRQGRGRHFDARVLDTFLAIVPDLHRTLTGIDDAQASAEEDAVLRRYFKV